MGIFYVSLNPGPLRFPVQISGGLQIVYVRVQLVDSPGTLEALDKAPDGGEDETILNTVPLDKEDW